MPAGSVFKSWADYRHSVEVDFTGLGGPDQYRGVKIIAAETIIRRADTGRPVARMPYQGPLTGKPGDQRPVQGEWTGDAKTYTALRTALPDDQAKVLDQNPSGDYLVAVYVNGVRASNVAKIRIDPAFDATKAPTLELGGIEPNPRAPLGFVVLWAIGPTPADPELTDFRLRYCSFILDGVVRQMPDGAYSGPGARPLTSGQRFAVSLHDGVGDAAFVPVYDNSQPHTYAMSFTPAERPEPSVRFGGPDTPSGMRRLYTAAPLPFDPKAHSLGDAWDQASPPGETRPVVLPAVSPAASAPVPSVNSVIPYSGADSVDLNSLVQSGASLADAVAAYAQLTHQTLSLPAPLPTGNLFFSPRPHYPDQTGWTKAQVVQALRVLLALNDVTLKDSPDGTQAMATVDLAAAASYSKLAGPAIEDRLKPLLADLRTNLVTVKRAQRDGGECGGMAGAQSGRLCVFGPRPPGCPHQCAYGRGSLIGRGDGIRPPAMGQRPGRAMRGRD